MKKKFNYFFKNNISTDYFQGYYFFYLTVRNNEINLYKKKKKR